MKTFLNVRKLIKLGDFELKERVIANFPRILVII